MFARSAAGRQESSWDGLLLKHVTDLMDQELYNQAVLACTVVPQLVLLASTQSVDSAALTALRASAKKLQKDNIDTNGAGTPLLSMPLHRVDAYIANIMSKVEGGLDTIARLGATINGKKRYDRRC